MYITKTVISNSRTMTGLFFSNETLFFGLTNGRMDSDKKVLLISSNFRLLTSKLYSTDIYESKLSPNFLRVSKFDLHLGSWGYYFQNYHMHGYFFISYYKYRISNTLATTGLFGPVR